jgi:HEAT repeat protein
MGRTGPARDTIFGMALDVSATARDVAVRFTSAVAIARFACSRHDDERRWDLLHEAAHDAPAATALATERLASVDASERATAADLLGVVAGAWPAVRADAASALLRVDADAAPPPLVASLVRAAGATRDVRTVPLLTAYASVDDPAVRRDVAASLAAVMCDEPIEAGVRALIRLTTDVEPEVRNWATFGLGWQLPVDGSDVRAALWARTRDDCADAREEGIRGLARRHDRRAVPLVAELLAAGDAHVFTFAAAAMLADGRLLEALSTYDPADPDVAAACEACDAVYREVADDAAWDLYTAVAARYPELPVALYCERFEPGIYLDLAPIGGEPLPPPMAGTLVSELYERAGYDLATAVELVALDLCGADDAV